MEHPKRTLVITLGLGGGVASMADCALELLRDAGMPADVAYYQPYRLDPGLSVPSWKLLVKSPASRKVQQPDGSFEIQVGTRLPELEWTRYLPWKSWTELQAQYDYCIVVCGSILPALSLAMSGRPFLAWVATDFSSDRRDRVALFPWHRKLIECLFEAPFAKAAERYALKKGRVLAISEFTANALRQIAPGIPVAVIPGFVDTERLRPQTARRLSPNPRIGSVGRLHDPRKNWPLLFRAFSRVLRKIPGATLCIVGSDYGEDLQRLALELGITENLEIHANLSEDALKEVLSEFDVFAVTALQEGLGLAALESMASGTPVVSTRCGGPEDFVRDGISGYLSGFDDAEFAEHLLKVLCSPEQYGALSQGALAIAESNYSRKTVARLFWNEFSQIFGNDARPGSPRLP